MMPSWYLPSSRANGMARLGTLTAEQVQVRLQARPEITDQPTTRPSERLVYAAEVTESMAKLVMPGRDPGGIIVTIVLGIVRAVLGGWLGRAIGLYGPGEPAGFVMALIGALILLGLYRLLVARRA